MVYGGNLDSVIWVTVAGSVFGLIGLCVRAVTKSNCKEFSCCFGIVTCSRHNGKYDIKYNSNGNGNGNSSTLTSEYSIAKSSIDSLDIDLDSIHVTSPPMIPNISRLSEEFALNTHNIDR